MYKKIIPYIDAANETSTTVIQLASDYCNSGADELFIYNYSQDSNSREEMLALAKKLTKEVDIPFILGMYVEKLEDIKKALYTGASYVMIKYALIQSKEVIKEAAERFGRDKIIIEVDTVKAFSSDEFADTLYEMGVGAVMLKHTNLTESTSNKIKDFFLPVMLRDSLNKNDVVELLQLKDVFAISTNHFEGKNIMKVKLSLKEQGINVDIFESRLPFSDFKLNEDGLIPVVVQEYRTDAVLMLAYMNKEAYEETLLTGKMTYYSRSRKSLWVKGETSGHFQYVKELSIDCDKDTLLAKVQQVGDACHTGSHSCFYTELARKDYKENNPIHILKEVYDTIADRKKNPRAGSYTNYLFDKGIDKILKKCGEEATEIVIAAKNPNADELKYEISDYLYHMMVLMVECGLDWNDINKELGNRH